MTDPEIKQCLTDIVEMYFSGRLIGSPSNIMNERQTEIYFTWLAGELGVNIPYEVK